jgi:hypothetical protein
MERSRKILPKTGKNCRVARQKLPHGGNFCPAGDAERQKRPGRIFPPRQKSMFKQI